ncbi:hypothetical protein LIER_20573 [Lithospermum erythrorhizon]|uniref:Uncharacterized protein n=1 Tax=Lithospermum erythrorhizon TaxID=34254 RepID=A0AAV3QR25_LITER
MDSSKSIGKGEECQSSESGWTMYLDLPMDNSEDDNDDGEVDEEVEEESDDKTFNDYGKDYDSDDSMVSDASSRPFESTKIGNGKYFDENKVVGNHGLKYKEPADDVPVKNNGHGTWKNQHLGATN